MVLIAPFLFLSTMLVLLISPVSCYVHLCVLHIHTYTGVIFNLSMLTEMAVANQHNCQRLCMLGHDVLALLDNAGVLFFEIYNSCLN